MSHALDRWTDRNGHRHSSCRECEEPWPCPSAQPEGRPTGYLIKGRLTADKIVTEVARGFDVDPADIYGDGRTRHVCMARACAMAVVKQATKWSYTTVGKHFNRDHTTVMNAVQKVNGDPELAEAVRLVVEELSPPPRLFAVDDAPEAEEAV